MGRVTTEFVIKRLKAMKKKAQRVYEIDKMLLFGSRARGEELLTSDVDVIVVSPDFEGISFKKRPDFFLDKWKEPVDFEVLCYTPAELERKRKEIGLVQEALKQAKVI